LTELRLEDIRAFLPVDFLAHVSAADICGAYGDPILARNLLEIIEYVRSANPKCRLTIFTNGGARSASWWRALASSLGNCGRVVFAIDGLEDTNAIYRRGVNFGRVVENAKAFIQAGGDAQWDFLVFRHNEHQLERARRLSEQIGFHQFTVKKTARFLKAAHDYVPELGDQVDLQHFPIFDGRGMVVGVLEPPSDPSLGNETVKLYTDVQCNRELLDVIFSQTAIRCRVQESRSVFVSASGHAFPCCWTYVQATAPIIYEFAPGVDTQMYKLVEECGGFAQIDAVVLGLAHAVESSLFEAIKRSWLQPSVAAGRQKVCARVCGVEFPAYRNQFQAPDLIPGEPLIMPSPT
jgi:hypothetical protein